MALFAPLLAPVVAFILREIVVKFVVFAAVFALVAILTPVALTYLGPYLGTSGLSDSFSSVPPGVWFFVDFFQLQYGLPILISALIARFMIRRLPVIG